MEPSISNSSVLTGFFSPLTIIVTIIAIVYFLSKLNTLAKSTENTRLNKLFLINLFTIELNKLLASFDRLLEDFDDDSSAFTQKNVHTARGAVHKLKKINEDFVNFSNDELKAKITRTLEEASDIVSNISTVEDIIRKSKSQYDKAVASSDYELYRLKIELLKVNVGLNEILYPVGLNDVPLDVKKKNHIAKLVEDIDKRKQKSITDSEKGLSFSKEKRTLLGTKLISIKSRLAELSADLELLKTNALKKNFGSA